MSREEEMDKLRRKRVKQLAIPFGLLIALSTIWRWGEENLMRLVLGLSLAVFFPLGIYRSIDEPKKYQIALLSLIAGAFLVAIDYLTPGLLVFALGILYILVMEIMRWRR